MRQRIDNGTLVLAMQEDLLSTNVGILSLACKNAIESSTEIKKLTVDLTATKFVDSKGLYLLISLYRDAHQRSWEFKVVGVADEVYQLLSFAKLVERFGLEPKPKET